MTSLSLLTFTPHITMFVMREYLFNEPFITNFTGNKALGWHRGASPSVLLWFCYRCSRGDHPSFLYGMREHENENLQNDGKPVCAATIEARNAWYQNLKEDFRQFYDTDTARNDLANTFVMAMSSPEIKELEPRDIADRALFFYQLGMLMHALLESDT